MQELKAQKEMPENSKCIRQKKSTQSGREAIKKSLTEAMLNVIETA